MNPVFKAAAAGIEQGTLMGVMTLFFLAIFTAWVLWAYAPSNRGRFEAASRLPFDDEDGGSR